MKAPKSNGETPYVQTCRLNFLNVLINTLNYLEFQSYITAANAKMLAVENEM